MPKHVRRSPATRFLSVPCRSDIGGEDRAGRNLRLALGTSRAKKRGVDEADGVDYGKAQQGPPAVAAFLDGGDGWWQRATQHEYFLV